MQLAGRQVRTLAEGPMTLLSPSLHEGTLTDVILGAALVDSHGCSEDGGDSLQG